MLDIAIIGGGPIGLYAGILCSLHGLSGMIFEARDCQGGQLKYIYPQKDIIDIPGQISVTASGFIDILTNQLNSQPNHPELRVQESVLDIQPNSGTYIVKTSAGKYEFKTILIASGMGNFSPRKTGLGGENAFDNIIYSIRDKDTLKGKRVVILGGGDSAVDWAMMLKPIVKELTIVHRRKEFRAQSASVDKMKKMGVNIKTPFVPHKLIGDNGVLKELVIASNQSELSDGEDFQTENLPLDTLFVNFGMVPGQNSFPLDKEGNSIKISNYFMTSLPNVFAIGNAINYPGKVKNITCGLGEAVIAVTKIDQIIHPGKNIPVHF